MTHDEPDPPDGWTRGGETFTAETHPELFAVLSQVDPSASKPEYTATRDHMRMNYIASERRRNAFHGKPHFQTDEELGEEFDRGMALLERNLRAEIAAQIRASCPDKKPCESCEADATLVEGAENEQMY